MEAVSSSQRRADAGRGWLPATPSPRLERSLHGWLPPTRAFWTRPLPQAGLHGWLWPPVLTREKPPLWGGSQAGCPGLGHARQWPPAGPRAQQCAQACGVEGVAPSGHLVSFEKRPLVSCRAGRTEPGLQVPLALLEPSLAAKPVEGSQPPVHSQQAADSPTSVVD